MRIWMFKKTSVDFIVYLLIFLYRNLRHKVQITNTMVSLCKMTPAAITTGARSQKPQWALSAQSFLRNFNIFMIRNFMVYLISWLAEVSLYYYPTFRMYCRDSILSVWEPEIRLLFNSNREGILLGPPGCAQNIPLLEPGSPRFFWWYENSE